MNHVTFVLAHNESSNIGMNLNMCSFDSKISYQWDILSLFKGDKCGPHKMPLILNATIATSKA